MRINPSASRQARSILRSAFPRGIRFRFIPLDSPGDRDQRTPLASSIVPDDVFTRDEWARRSRDYWVKSTGLGMSMGVTVFLGILVGVVIVAQTLYTSAVEHIKEFGTVKAIGGSNLDIYRILGEQALIAAVVGFALGAAFSFVARPIMAGIHLNVLISPGFTAVVFAGTVLMCLGSALFSFRRVARIDPALVCRA